MSDEKLDLILTVVSDIKLKVDNLETRFDRFETKVDSLETRFDRLETKVDGLDSEFKGFRVYVTDSFSAIQKRFNTLEKQMIAIGIEVKSEIKLEIQAVGEQIDRLEEEVLLNRTNAVSSRRKIREFEIRLTSLESQFETQLNKSN